MLCSYDDLCYIICTVLRGRHCVIQHSYCNTNKTIIVIIRVKIVILRFRLTDESIRKNDKLCELAEVKQSKSP